MKILVVSQHYWPENLKINDLVKGMHEKGHDVTVYTALPNYPKGSFFDGYSLFKGPYYETHEGIKIIRCPLVPRGKKKGFQLFLNYLSFTFISSLLAPFLVKGKFDHVFVYEVSPVIIGFTGIVLKFLKKCPMHFWVTDLWPETTKAVGVINNSFLLYLIQKVVNVIYFFSDTIFISCKGFAEKIAKQGVPEDKIHYLPYWAETIFEEITGDHQSEHEKSPSKPFTILYTGNIATAQSFETVVDAMKELKQETNNVHFKFIGSGLMRNWLEEQIKIHNLHNISVEGPYSLSETLQHNLKADALFISLRKSSAFEITVPAKLQNYMASGRPIIASIDGETATHVLNAKAGLVSKASDPQGLKNNILKLYRLSIEERKLMGRNAKDYYNNNFKRDRRLETLFDRMQSL